MYDAKDLLKLIKQAAAEAVEASGPVAVCTGTVINAAPLQVKISSKLTLGSHQMIKCLETGELANQDHVVLLRQQGGQKYIILGVF